MRLVRCDACGSKAILAASQCPKCAEPLYVRDSRGNDVPLSRCRTCDTYYPRTRGSCRWCSTEQRPTGVPRWVAGAAAALVVAVSALGIARLVPSGSPAPVPNVAEAEEPPPPRRPAAREPDITRLPPATIVPVVATGTVSATPAAGRVAPPPSVVAPAPSRVATGITAGATPSPEPDSGRGSDASDRSFARATTWVNVRSEPASESPVVGIILPDSIVERGELRRGWRRVTTPRLTGWAAEKLFVVDSTVRSRG